MVVENMAGTWSCWRDDRVLGKMREPERAEVPSSRGEAATWNGVLSSKRSLAERLGEVLISLPFQTSRAAQL
jgi:hypothetical protein